MNDRPVAVFSYQFCLAPGVKRSAPQGTQPP
nr:MAG TPA: hypothetical protein [Caudoviricetes sp.]